jgi:four helix bundle protein
MGVKRFQDLICWQLSRDFRKLIAQVIKKPPLSRDFDLCAQMRRAARSATGNIAEGFKCPSHAEFARFLDIAHRSLAEIEDRFIECLDSELITKEEGALGLNLAKRASVAVSRLTKYLRPEK